tara:strand:+ start:1043 stop:1336 length:294 start_codon:yes stop_codon:yes gene_type:complete
MSGTNNIDKVSNNIFMILDGDDKTPYDWDGMPEFVQEKDEWHDEVSVRFKNQEDLEKFAILIGQPNLIPRKKRRKTCWYPAYDIDQNRSLFWVEDND